MKRIFAIAAALALTGSVAAAQSFEDQVIEQLQGEGFTRIEIDKGPSEMKVEAIRGERKIEVVYDMTTGKILKQETGAVEADDDTNPGVEVKSSDGNFTDDSDDDGDDNGRDGDDDDSDDDSSDDGDDNSDDSDGDDGDDDNRDGDNDN